MADEQKLNPIDEGARADTIANSKAAAGDGKSKAAAAEAPADVKLPPVLTMEAAQEIAGKNARAFFNEVAMICFGDVSEHLVKELAIGSVKTAADDGSPVHKQFLAQIQKLANDYAAAPNK